jgi:hypothetical protein
MPPTSSNHGIGPHPATLTNPDTMSTLMSDTLVSCMEPPPSRWTEIILEKTYKYRNHYRGTRFTFLIMQGIRYKYKLIMKHMSDTTEYKSYKFINYKITLLQISKNYKG